MVYEFFGYRYSDNVHPSEYPDSEGNLFWKVSNSYIDVIKFDNYVQIQILNFLI